LFLDKTLEVATKRIWSKKIQSYGGLVLHLTLTKKHSPKGKTTPSWEKTLFGLFVSSFFGKILFFKKMTYHKKNPNNSEWNSDRQNHTEAHPNGAVHLIVMHKNKWAQSKTDNNKDYTANIFPFPGNK